MPDALLDLLLGSGCAVCGTAGRVLCLRCRRGLPREASTCLPSPCPPGLATPVATGAYAGALKLLVNAHKEQGRFALARPLGDLLATAVGVHTGPPAGGSQPVLLVPVPSRGAVVRRRGHDPLLRIALQAASRLRGQGVPATVARLLSNVRTVEDQAGLGAADRASNLAGSMTCPRRRARRWLRSEAAPFVVVVDDVITTGATVREAQRALEEPGLLVSGIAAVAATRRTSGRPVAQDLAGESTV